LFVATDDLYRHIPQDPFYVRLATLIDWTFVYELTRPLYAAQLGRPSLDPVVFIKCLLFGFFEEIPEYRRLALRLAESLTARRFLGYALDEATPDESTLRKTLARYPDETFQAIFTTILAQCQAAGMVAGRHLGVDSSTVEAQASLDSLRHRTLGCTYRAYVQTLRSAGEPVPATVSNTDWESSSDPEARLAVMKDGHVDLAYKVTLATDLESGLVLGVDVTTADVSDRHDLLPALEQACATLDALGVPPPVTVTADKGYHDGVALDEVAELGITPIIRPPAPPQPRAPGFAPGEFAWDPATDTLTCPAGQVLRRQPGEERQRAGDRQFYRASGVACRACPHFGTCTRDRKGRKVGRSPHETAIQANAARAGTVEGQTLLTARQTRGEAPFSYGKHGGRGRIRGRGLPVATKQLLISYLGWNCVLLLKYLARELSLDAGWVAWHRPGCHGGWRVGLSWGCSAQPQAYEVQRCHAQRKQRTLRIAA
jgi:transposase